MSDNPPDKGEDTVTLFIPKIMKRTPTIDQLLLIPARDRKLPGIQVDEGGIFVHLAGSDNLLREVIEIDQQRKQNKYDQADSGFVRCSFWRQRF